MNFCAILSETIMPAFATTGQQRCLIVRIWGWVGFLTLIPKLLSPRVKHDRNNFSFQLESLRIVFRHQRKCFFSISLIAQIKRNLICYLDSLQNCFATTEIKQKTVTGDFNMTFYKGHIKITASTGQHRCLTMRKWGWGWFLPQNTKLFWPNVKHDLLKFGPQLDSLWITFTTGNKKQVLLIFVLPKKHNPTCV